MPDLVMQSAAHPVVAEWDHALVDPNLEDATIEHTLASFAHLPGLGKLESEYRRRFRHKTWQYMTASSPDCFVAFVIGTAGFASNGFVYVVEPASGKVHSKFAITPFTTGVSLARSSAAGSHRFEGSGLTVAIDNLEAGRRFLAKVTAPGIALDLAFTSAPRDEHHAQCVPLAGGRWNYTHKFGAFGVAGTVELDGRRFELRPDTAFGTLDFTKMYALRHAVWRWVALAGRTRAGNVVGLNLVDPTPTAAFSENAAWLDGRRIPLTDVHLDCGHPDDPRGPWSLTAQHLALEMRAIAHVEQKLDVPLVKHRLRHVVGAFSGALTVDGTRHELDELVGIAEDNDTWW
ncbi:MAG: DUF2804 domain-containing protein [Deltaproteobacteria bacterium]|nr:DUF2804 domain-containing protein [Deltaproteobacteria bacterium]